MFNMYPYTDFHELNLDWLLKQIREINATLKNFIVMNTIKYADPFQWNITTQYESNTIVMEPNTGIAYISVQPVPAGVSISNTDFWTPVFDLSQMFRSYNDNITFNNEYLNIISTHAYNAGDWLIWKNNLYRVDSAISIGDAIQPGVNITKTSVEILVNTLSASITAAITSIQNDIATLEASNYIVTPEMFGAAGDGITDDTAAVNAAISSGKIVIGKASSKYLIRGNMDHPDSLSVGYSATDHFMLYITHKNTTLRNLYFIVDCSVDFQYLFANAIGVGESGYKGLDIIGCTFDFNGSMSSVEDAVGNRRLILRDIAGTNKNMHIYDNVFLWSGENVAYLAMCENVYFDNNYFKYVGGNNDNTALAIYGVENCVISNNYFTAKNKTTDSTSHDIYDWLGYAGLEVHSVNSIEAHHNTFDGLVIGMDVCEPYSVVTNLDCGFINVHDNKYINCYRDIQLWSSAGKLKHVDIYNEVSNKTYASINNFRTFYPGYDEWGFIVSRRELNVPTFGKMEDIKICNNIVKTDNINPSSDDIWLYGTIDLTMNAEGKDILISDNKIIGYNLPVMHIGDRSVGGGTTGVDNLRISNNDIQFYGNYATAAPIIRNSVQYSARSITITNNSFTYLGTGRVIGIIYEGLSIDWSSSGIEKYIGRNNKFFNMYAKEMFDSPRTNPKIYFVYDQKNTTGDISICYLPGGSSGETVDIDASKFAYADHINVYSSDIGTIIPVVAGARCGYISTNPSTPTAGTYNSVDPSFRSVALA